MVAHANVVNLVSWTSRQFEVGPGDRFSSVAATGFDASVWEIWTPLSVGATLVLAPPQTTGDAQILLEWWANERLDIAFLPTPIAELAFSQGLRNPHLRTLLVGADRWRSRVEAGGCALINNYGPTESTVVATSGEIVPEMTDFTIGRPISNTQIYILDVRLRPVPIGVAGEMYIGGMGVARGYLNRPDLTEQRFVLDPFSPDANARMYRTGDLARWREDGSIEFLGRNDDQVKIRGHRIELGEIESQLLRHEDVQEAVVLALEGQLVAYVCVKEDRAFDIESLRAHLRLHLPAYMVPNAFLALGRLPLTPNGKLDRRALPTPVFAAGQQRAYEAPKGETEQVISGVWRELLQVERVGRTDNFFELGGHSLIATQAMARIRSWLSIEVPMRVLFDFPTVESLGAELDRRVHAFVLETMSEESIEELVNKMERGEPV